MHLGVIPDGNRRYARENNLERYRAYRKSRDLMVEIFKQFDELEVDVEELTVFLLSEDNLNRGEEELEDLFELMEKSMESFSDELAKEGFSFNWASTRPEALPDHLREKLERLEQKHSDGQKQINALISYSGKSDIIQAANRASGEGEINEESLERNLEVGSEIDFVIRTGDNPHRECISDFPIWNASYAEYYHIKKHFPDITFEDVQEAINHYKELRKKRGK